VTAWISSRFTSPARCTAFRTSVFTRFATGAAAPTTHTTTADGRTKDLHDDTGTEGDSFGATTARRYIAYLTIAYMAARRSAESGSRGFLGT
jgi:hypothetical protein